MKKLSTLAAMAALATTSLSAQAQVTLDGQILPAEGYTKLGMYTSTIHGFGDHGLVALYAKATATKIYIGLTGAVEGNGNSLQIYLNVPGKTGVAAGTALPKGAAGTSFEKDNAIMEMPVSYAFGVKGGTAASMSSIIDYTRVTGAGAAATATDQVTGDLPVSGTAVTVPSTTTGGLSKTRMAFKNVFTLVGATAGTPTHNGTQGWEIELDKVDLGIADATVLQLFAAQNNSDGGYFSSDVIPEVTGNTTTTNSGNLATNPNFVTLPGVQFVNFTATALASRSAVASALNFSVYPNPASDASFVSYKVPQGKQSVSLNVYDSMGKQVRSLSEQQAGNQSYRLSGLASGVYVVKLNVGNQVTSQKVVIE